MATHLDLEEQEQLDQLKAFWSRWGNLITWTLIAVLAAFAAWNGYNFWQRRQAQQAVVLFEEVERAVQAGDMARVDRSVADLKERYGRTAYAQQAGLLAAKAQVDKNQLDAARQSLAWVAEKGGDDGYRAVARLRLSALLMENKAYDDALKQIADGMPPQFDALVADRRGDIHARQGKTQEAVAAYRRAYQGMELRSEYRRLVEVKLAALGADPEPAGGAKP